MQDDESQVMMTGNAAIAYGAIEAGVGFCASYPGTPSTEITLELMRMADKLGIHVEWSVNEKVALEACAGASWAGIPAICPMKSLGLNVAADFLLNLNLTGSGPGGLVIVVCDDPRGHSSSNEQDSRFYAKAAYLPLLEPTSCEEAKEVTKEAFSLSRRYEIPVIVRSTTRLSHSSALVTMPVSKRPELKASDNLPERLYNVPDPHLRHKDLLQKLDAISRDACSFPLNTKTESEANEVLIIASGVGYRYGLEASQKVDEKRVSIAKLVTTHPLPEERVLTWLRDARHVVFLEEGDPFVEDQTLALIGRNIRRFEYLQHIGLHGKRTGAVPSIGELDADIAMEALRAILGISKEQEKGATVAKREKAMQLLVSRPLTFCAGCTHRNVYWAIRQIRKRLKDGIIVAGDIGCYSLGVFYDQAMNTMQSMGSGIGTANGLGQLHKFGFEKKVIAVAGDSTFFHACVPALVNARHMNAELTFIILDNATTAMTGFQSHPGAKEADSKLSFVSIEEMVRAVHPDHFDMIDGENIEALTATIHSTIKKGGLKVLLVKSICRLKERTEIDGLSVVFIDESCKGESCRICVDKFACPALDWDEDAEKAVVIEHSCIRCGACILVCPHGAIRRAENE